MTPVRSVALLTTLALAAGCNRANDLDRYRPSLTMLRVGEVVVEEPPVIPEDNFIPGITIAPEQFLYPDEGSGLRLAPSMATALTDFGTMKEVANPPMLDKHADTYEYTIQPASLIDEDQERDLVYDDVNPGAIANCYFVAALSSVMYADRNGDIKNGLVREIRHPDGSFSHYVVRFYDAWGVPQDVEVDPQLVRRSGKPLYARSADSSSTAEELWVGIVEKAYAKWHNTYEKIGNGGYTGDAMQALTGANASYRSLRYQSDASLYAAISEALNDGRPVASGTFGEDDGVDYTGTGVYAWHAYSVLGVEQAPGGEYRIQLRNPWGSSEPADNGPDDGIFWISFREWRQWYSAVTLGGKFEPDRIAPSQVVDLRLLDVRGDRAVVEFTATGDDATAGLAYAYDVRVLDRPIDDTNFYQAEQVPTVDPQSPGTLEQIEVPGMVAGSVRYIAVRVLDESGNASPISNLVEVAVEGGPPPATTTYFDFEQAGDGWTSTGLFHRSDLDATSGQFSWYMGVEEQLNYDTGGQVVATLTSPVIDLTGIINPEVLWDHVLDVEDGEYDAAWVEVSTDGFATSSVIWTKTTPTTSWRFEWASLAAWEGRQVQVRFAFDSFDGVSNEGLGWFIDDVWFAGF